MHAIDFTTSTPGTVGTELEWILVDAINGQQLAAAPELLQHWQQAQAKGNLKGEVFTSIIEMNSSVHHHSRDCLHELQTIKTKLSTLASDIRLLPSSTHPYARWQEQQLSEGERYAQLEQRLRWMLHRYNIVGMHVHIGMPDGETCIQASNHLLPLLPMFLALSANSPYWAGHDTGLASARIKIAEGLSQGGMPFYFQNWADFQRCTRQLLATHSIDSIRDIWWEMRPHPDYGTLEIRISDLPATLADTEACVAYIRAEAIAAMAQGAAPMVHHSLIRENRWRACRFGMQAAMIDPWTATVMPMLDWLEQRLDFLQARAPAEELAIVAARLPYWRIHGDGASRQRQLADLPASSRIQHQVSAWDEAS